MTPRPIGEDFALQRPEDDRPPFDLKVLVLYGIARFRKPIIGLGILGAMFGLFAGAAKPNVYATSAKLRFVPSARQTLTEEAAFGVEIREFRGRMSSAIEEELQLLGDPVIYERAADQIGAQEILRVADPRSGDGPNTPIHKRFMHSLQAGLIHLKGQDDPVPDGNPPWARAAAAGKLLANTKIKTVGRTNIIEVIYTDSSPAKAKTIGDEIIKQMRARHLEEFEAQKQLVVLKDTKNNAFQEWKSARSEALEFKNQCGFFDLVNDFRACEDQIRNNRLKEQDLEQDRQKLLGQIKGLEDELGLRATGGDADDPTQKPLNPQWVSLQGDIKKVDDELFELRLKANPGILNKKRQRQLEEQKAQYLLALEKTEQFGAGSGLLALGDNANEALIQTQTLLSTAKGDLQGIISQIEVVRKQLKDLEQRRRTMEECTVEHQRLEDAVKTAEAKYKDLSTNEIMLSSLASMDQEDRSNLSLFRSARMPKTKVGPQRSKPVLMGLIGGFGLGIGLAVLRQLLERRIRYRETVENQLGLPVLCTVSDLSGSRRFRGARGVA